MAPFFEILSKKIGFSRLGRFPKSQWLNVSIKTPQLLIPINKQFMKQMDFIEEFIQHDGFIITEERFLKRDFLLEKFKNSGVIYTHIGTIDEFQQILTKKIEIFNDYNLISIIPFSIPTTSINKAFVMDELEQYLEKTKKILLNHSNLFFGLSIRIFDYPELIEHYIQFIQDNPQIKMLNLLDVFDNLNNYRGILRLISEIKSKLDNNLVIMASGRVLPKIYPILIYLGIDIIDPSYLLYLSSENFYDTIEYLLPVYKIKNIPCSCVACRGKLKDFLEHKYSIEKIMLLCLHNLISAKNYFNKTCQYLSNEDFRAFIEKSSLDDMNLISMLKILDREYSLQLRKETPIVQELQQIKCLGASSYYRPDFVEFRERTTSSFDPESWTSLILLLPCSAKKPYSESRSHKQFNKAIRKFPEYPQFQEIILTSPLGAIPRQLENIYPVNFYDISVTGIWDQEEIDISARMLVKLLEKYDPNIPVICHLEGGYLDIVKRAQKELKHSIYFTEISDNLTSKESLLSLENLVKIHMQSYQSKATLSDQAKTSTWHRKCIKIADYFLGKGSGIAIFPNDLRVKQDKSRTRIEIIDKHSKEKLATFYFNTGGLILTIKGARRLLQHNFTDKTIIFNGEKISGNNLFKPGVMKISSEMNPEENVFILDTSGKNIIGIGSLVVSTKSIEQSKTGKLAKIVEKSK